jgi:hypothetical protein
MMIMRFFNLQTSRVLFALALALSITPSPLAAASPLNWRWSNPSPHGNNIVDMISTNGIVLQVCERGRIYASSDLQTWIPKESRTTSALRSVCFFNNQFLISGADGTVVTGGTNLDFTPISLGTVDWLEGITASPNLAVAVGDNGAIYTSGDGKSWQRQAVPFTTWLRSVAFGTPGNQPTFVAVGEQGFAATSNDGKKWQAVTALTPQNLNRVAWTKGQFWAVGDAGAAFSSANGKSWSPIQTGATNTLNIVAGAAGSTVLAGDYEVRLDEGRGTWSDETAATKSFPAPLWNYLCGFNDGASYLLGGRTGMFIEGFKTNATSATFWLPFVSSTRNWLWDLKAFPSALVAVGDGATVMTSLDGVSWAQESLPTAPAGTVFLGVGGRTNLAVAVGTAGTIMLSHDDLLPVVSTNLNGTLSTNFVGSLGIAWSLVQPAPTANDLQGVAEFNGLLVVTGGNGTVLTSPDGAAWQTHATPTTSFLSSVAAGSGGLVAVGKGGTILQSADAVSWTPRVSNTTNWIYRIRSFPTKWIAVGQNGTILTSADGSNWAKQAGGTTSWLNDIILVGDTFFAIGNQGTVLTSPDAIQWSNAGMITSKSLYGAATRDGRLIVAGVEGVILRAQVIPPSAPVALLKYPQAAAQNFFLFGGQTDQRFMLDRSTNLIDWLQGPLLEITDPTGTFIYQDSGTNAPGIQFFRAKPLP